MSRRHRHALAPPMDSPGIPAYLEVAASDEAMLDALTSWLLRQILSDPIPAADGTRSVDVALQTLGARALARAETEYESYSERDAWEPPF